MKRTTVAAALLVCVALSPTAALATDTATSLADPNAMHRATNEAPPGLKSYVREQDSPREKLIAVGLIALMTAAGAASAYLMNNRTAEADRMYGDAYNRWTRDRSMGHRRE